MAIGILSLLDDVAALMDDVAIMSKAASKKVAGVLGDDLAVNVENATGFHASRELPVLWAISKGSVLNKVIILPVVFLLSAFMEWIVVPILLLGGAYLSYEGAEKVYEWFSPPHKDKPAAIKTSDKQEILKAEKRKIKSAIRTDFILSIEIVVIALGVVIQETLIVRIMAVSFVALLATIGVYGLVALLVRMDDAGISLMERSRNMEGGLAVFVRRTGKVLVKSLPKIIHLLGYVATIAMLLVGGGIFTHNIHALHNIARLIPSVAGDLCVGLTVGMVLLVIAHLVARIKLIMQVNSSSDMATLNKKLKPWESIVLECLINGLDEESGQILRKQIKSINKIQRFSKGKEANLYCLRRGKSAFDESLNFNFDVDQVIMATVDLHNELTGEKIKTKFWLVSGHLFSIQFSRPPKSLTKGKGNVVASGLRIILNPMKKPQPVEVSVTEKEVIAALGIEAIEIRSLRSDVLHDEELKQSIAAQQDELPSELLNFYSLGVSVNIASVGIHSISKIRSIVYDRYSIKVLAEDIKERLLCVVEGKEGYFLFRYDMDDPMLLNGKFKDSLKAFLEICEKTEVDE